MKWNEFEAKTSNFLLLNRAILDSLERNKNSAKANISYWLKTGRMLSLKRGLYLVKEKYLLEPDKDLYLEYISNQLLKPAYLSLEYVMAKYQLLSEPVNAITLITASTTRTVKNDLAVFRYYSIAPNFFTGYKLKYFYGAPILEAEKEKAIFDFIYLRFLKNQAVNEKTIDELRVNWIQVKANEWRKVKAYGTMCRSRRVEQALNLIGVMYFNDKKL